MDQYAVEAVNLSKAFGGVHAVDGVSIAVPPGQRRALIGPNGAGKTTLFNCLTGSMSPSAGRIMLFGKDVTSVAEHRRTAMGIGRTFQITNVFHDLTVVENVLLALQGTSRRKWVFHRSMDFFRSNWERAGAELERVGLAGRASDTVGSLSYGERRQLELALALASTPRVLLLDEPASGLSPGERKRIAEILAELQREITIVFIEHDMSVVLGLADKVTVLHRGRAIMEGTPDEVKASREIQEIYLGNV
ncbi:MAG: ABC transporter ATP-binding protein [Candidatus Krumholzibacteria bacterium]